MNAMFNFRAIGLEANSLIQCDVGIIYTILQRRKSLKNKSGSGTYNKFNLF